MYQIVFDHIESGAAMDAAQEFREMGHRVLTAEEAGEITPDILVLTVPSVSQNDEDGSTEKGIGDGLDYSRMLDTVSGTLEERLQLAKSMIARMQGGGLKRIALLTEQRYSVRETADQTDYGTHMAAAGLHMMLRILFNTYRPDGFTFRCYAASEKASAAPAVATQSRDGDAVRSTCSSPHNAEPLEGISAADYILTNQSYIAQDDYIHSDENRIVMRDAFLREISW